MAYDDMQSQVGTMATVWIVVIVVLVVLSVVGFIVAIWLWRRHVSRRKKRMEAFYATPIPQQDGGPLQQPQTQQCQNYSYQQQPQEAPGSPLMPQPAQLPAQETGVSNNGHNNYQHNNDQHKHNNNNNYNTQTASELYG
ncbi:uncharacterized protein PG986_013960 [Apiospora aurea]|uniref:Uncharacterized protein n=1 Tax=Apiospora aurea TaxID=335848 RepID=A0ABR1PXD8_9PEZI